MKTVDQNVTVCNHTSVLGVDYRVQQQSVDDVYQQMEHKKN